MKTHIFKTFRLIALLFILFHLSSDVHATHIIGGDLSYKHISGDQYEITLTLRRDCNLGQVDFDNPASIGLYSATTNVFFREIRIPFVESDTVGNILIADCGFQGSVVCVQTTTYKTIQTLPVIPGGYIIAYQRCCRNGSLNNVINPLESGSTEWVEISERALMQGNSSPTFKNWPDVYICANKPLVFDHSASESDGDSLVYKICTPFDGGTIQFPQPQPPSNPPYNVIQWRNPYTLSDMMGGTPLVINPKTGVITANPNLVGQFLIGVCVEEYRNGVLMATVRRDFQYNVRVCNEPLVADFDAVVNNPCDSLSYVFTNKTNNASSFEWNFNFPSKEAKYISTLENPLFRFEKAGIYTVRLLVRSSQGACDATILKEIEVRSGGDFPSLNLTSSALNLCPGVKANLLLMTDSINKYQWSPLEGLDLSNPTNPIFTGGKSADYNVTVTNANNCSSTGTISIVVKPATPILTIIGNRNVCDSVNLNVSGGNGIFEWSNTSSFNGIISNTSSLKVLISGSSAKYFVRSVGADCGDVTDSVTVINQTIQLTYPENAVICKGTEKEILINKLNLSHNLTYTSADPHIVSINGNIITVQSLDSDSSTFILNVRVTNQYNCSQDISIAFEIISPVKISGDKDICNDIVSLQATGGNGNFEWSNTREFTNIISTKALLETTLKNVSETFYVRHTSPECKEFIDSVTVTNQSINITFPANAILCSGSTKDLIITNNTAAHSLTYTSSDPHIVSINGNTITVQSLEGDGTSFTLGLTITNQYNCSKNISIAFEIISPVKISGDKDICNDIVSLQATGGNGNFEWSNTREFTNIISTKALLETTLKNVSETFYVRHTSPECKEFIDSVTVTNQSINITYPTTGNICKDGTKDITITNNVSDHALVYTSSDPHVVSILNNVVKIETLPSDGATFTVNLQVLNQYNCRKDISIVLQVISPVKISGSNDICDEKVKLTVTGGAGGYQWSNTSDFIQIIGQTNVLEVNLTLLTQTFFVRSTGSACTKNLDSIKVTNQSIRVNVPDGGNICKGSTKEVTIANLVPGHNLNFIWNDPHVVSSDGNTLQVKTLENDTTTFEVKGSVTNQYNCTKPISILFRIKDQKPVTFKAELLSCNDFTMCFKTDGTYEGKILWNFGSGLEIDTSTQATPCFKYNNSGKYQVTLTNLNAECPFIKESAEITVPEIGDSIVTVSIKQDICQNSDVCFSITGKYFGNLKWDFGNPASTSNSATSPDPCHTFTAAGSYIVSLKSENTVCPFKEVKTNITVTPKFVVNPLANQTVCEGKDATLNASSNDSLATYSWFDATGKLLGTGKSLTVNPMTAMDITLIGLNNKGCKDSTKVMISTFKFNYTVDLPKVYCPKTDYQIKLVIANPENYTYVWTPTDIIVNGGTTNQPIFMAATGKTIKVVITNKATGCSETREITPVIEAPLIYSFSGTLCNDQSSTLNLNITNSSNYTYVWSPTTAIVSGGTTNSPVVKVTQGQVLKVLVTNKTTGCAEELSYTAQVLPQVTVTFTEPNIEIKQGASTDISVKNPLTGGTYTWSTGEKGTSIKVTPFNTTTYTVTVSDTNGCTGSGQITVNVRVIPCSDKDEYLPNAFTPNGDGKNDILYVKSNAITELEYVIFNRWGQEMFSTNNINEGWDGRYQGREMSPDVYAYYIKGTCLNGDKFIKKGNVSLLR